MKRLLCLLLLACAFTASAAFPPFTAFIGSNGITVISNPATGKIIISGSGISGGGSTNVSASTNGQPVTIGVSNFNFAHPAFRLTNDPAGNVNVGLDASLIETPGRFSTNVNSSFSNLAWNATAFVDPTNGHNTTAILGDASKPYRDPWAAAHAASNYFAGTGRRAKVYVRTGSYATNDLLRNGVDWNWEPGAEVYWTNSTRVTNGSGMALGIFDDRGKGAVNSRVGGNGRFYYASIAACDCAGNETTFTGNSNEFGAVVITNAASNIYIEGEELTGFFAYSTHNGVPSFVTVKNCTNADIRFKRIVDDLFTGMVTNGVDSVGLGPVTSQSIATGVWWELGETHIHSSLIKARYYGVYAVQPATPDIGANLWVTADRLENQGGGACFYALGTAGKTNGWKTWLEVKELVSAGGVACWAPYVNGRHYLTALKLTAGSGSHGIASAGGVGGDLQCWATAQKISISGSVLDGNWVNLALLTNTAQFYLSVMQYEDAGMPVGGNGFIQDSGQLYINPGIARTTNSTIFRHYGGSLNVTKLKMYVSNTNSCVLTRTNDATFTGCTFSNLNTRFTLTTDVNATNRINILGCYGVSDMTNKLTNAVGPFTISTFVQ